MSYDLNTQNLNTQSNGEANQANKGEAAAATALRIMTTEAAVKLASLAGENKGKRLLTARFRNPARVAHVLISQAAWQEMEAALSAPEAAAYKPLLSAVLETAAKSILAKRLGDMSVWPNEISAALFTSDAILTEAAGANTEWLSKEELTQAWEQSATRANLTTDSRYQANKAYRQAVNMFADLIIKLSGKTSQYQESELDKMLVKLDEKDHETEFGTFVLRRIEQIRNKPVRATIDLDCL